MVLLLVYLRMSYKIVALVYYVWWVLDLLHDVCERQHHAEREFLWSSQLGTVRFRIE